MSTLTGRQINVMMRLKFHFQIVQNVAQVLIILHSHYSHSLQNSNTSKFPQKTCTRAIKTINKICTKIAHRLKER